MQPNQHDKMYASPRCSRLFSLAGYNSSESVPHDISTSLPPAFFTCHVVTQRMIQILCLLCTSSRECDVCDWELKIEEMVGFSSTEAIPAPGLSRSQIGSLALIGELADSYMRLMLAPRKDLQREAAGVQGGAPSSLGEACYIMTAMQKRLTHVCWTICLVQVMHSAAASTCLDKHKFDTKSNQVSIS